MRGGRHYVIKAEVCDLGQDVYVFAACKTMYGGKLAVAGDAFFLFASGRASGSGLFAKGVAMRVTPHPRLPGIQRQTPRIGLTIQITARARRPLGRAGLRGFTDWKDGRPETELNFKLYRQATDKAAGISEQAAAFLDQFF